MTLAFWIGHKERRTFKEADKLSLLCVMVAYGLGKLKVIVRKIKPEYL
jgi:hypothetical protein